MTGPDPRRKDGLARFRARLLPWWLYAALVVLLLAGAGAVLRDRAGGDPTLIGGFMLVLALVCISFAVLAWRDQRRPPA